MAGGRYTVGSSRSPDEQPVLTVLLDPFWISQEPVTNAAFAKFIEADGYRRDEFWTEAGWTHITSEGIDAPSYWNDPVWGQPETPVTGVSWWEAMAYAKFVDAYLPSEAQWEAACAGPSHSTFPWGEEPPSPVLANFAPDCDPVERKPTRADTFARNKSFCGCRDMVGNFAEWCRDNYEIAYKFADETRNPMWEVDELAEHVVRGGSGLHSDDFLRCSARDTYVPGLRDNLISFRYVRPALESPET